MAAEQEALEERQSRLQALRLAADLANTEEETAAEDEEVPQAEEQPETAIKFRNYVPRDEQLQQLKLVPPVPPKFDDPLSKAPDDANAAEDPLISIAPKKANWDLRRDVAKKLEKLERRTQRAIIELMQEEEKRRQEAAEVGADEME